MLFGERPNLSEMQPFGCRAFVLTEDRKILDSKAHTGIILGYSSSSNCFIKCTERGFPERKLSKIWTSRNVTSNMDCFPGAVTSVDTDMAHGRCEEATLHYDTGLRDVKGSLQVEQAKVDVETIPNIGHLDDEDDNTQPQRNEPGRRRRNVIQPRRLDEILMANELENKALHSEAFVASALPRSAADALADPNWKAAMQRE